EVGAARVITATNCFAHIEDIHSVVSAIMNLLADDGVFVTESHYLMSLLETVQYDTVYHEHLRYYSLTSLQHLLAMNGLEVVHAKRIPTHGGSIRVYAARKGAMTPRSSVREILDEETAKGGMASQLAAFRDQVAASKYELLAMIAGIKDAGQRIVGISAPSRASTLVNYVGIDESMMDCVLEIPGSRKIGKNMPGTVIPVVDEALLFDEQPDFALLMAWHIGDELASKLRASGYKGQFIIPLPEPRVI
ncbi:MAG: methyltransferase domain-containing protein, partial [Rhodospirillaceae bacterium]|nr:methyltransferase domain-containing protein [Rhodospirillaceae bacterium]